jgi:hypothetical protein
MQLLRKGCANASSVRVDAFERKFEETKSFAFRWAMHRKTYGEGRRLGLMILLGLCTGFRGWVRTPKRNRGTLRCARSKNIPTKGPRNCRSRRLHSEFVTFLSSGVVCGRKAPKSILPTSIAGVLRLRAIKPSVRDRSAKRFAQDDGFFRGWKYSWLDMQKTRKDLKSHRLSG